MSTHPRHVPGNLGGRMLDEYSRFSRHAARRWDERAPIGAVEPADAWRFAGESPDELVDRVETLDGDTPDRVRVFRGRDASCDTFDMVFVCCDTPNPLDDDAPGNDRWTNIVTCYLADSAPSGRLERDLRAVAGSVELGGTA